MRWHKRLLLLCTVAVFAAGCSDSDRPTEQASQPSITAPSFDVLPPNTACMGDFIWADTNCNGIQDAGEVGLEGVTVKMYSCIGNTLTDETVTDATGYYALFGPPNSYYIVVTLPNGCTFSPRGVGQPDGRDIGTDSDVDETGKGHCTILGDQEIEKEMDAGICCGTECTSTIGDRVWFDSNCNGIQDKDEAGVEGVDVDLIDCATGGVVSSTTTNASGAYLFTGVADGEYKVCIDVPAGYEITLKDQGTNDGLDSDGGADGCTDCFEVSCESDLSRDFGLCEDKEPCESSIGDRVWFDSNCNGIQDKDEAGAQGVTVNLYTCAGVLVETTVTSASGGYLFDELESGSYKVCIEVPEGYEITLKDQGTNDGLDSDGGADGCTDCFEVDCEDDLTRDFGLCEEKGGGEGCTPGFWRNHLEHWAATPYSPGDLVSDVFGCDLAPAGTTLGQAIDAPQTYGVLLFHAIAALLNEAHPDVDYDHTASEIIDYACAGNKDILADSNEDGCTLSGDNTTGGGGEGSLKRSR